MNSKGSECSFKHREYTLVLRCKFVRNIFTNIFSSHKKITYSIHHYTVHQPQYKLVHG